MIAIHCGHTVKSTAPPLLPVSDSDTIVIDSSNNIEATNCVLQVLSYTPPASEAQETAETAPLGTESMDTDQGAPSNQATSPVSHDLPGASTKMLSYTRQRSLRRL